MNDYKDVTIARSAGGDNRVELSVLTSAIPNKHLRKFHCDTSPVITETSRTESWGAFSARVNAYYGLLETATQTFLADHPAVQWAKTHDCDVAYECKSSVVSCVYTLSDAIIASGFFGQNVMPVAETRITLTIVFRKPEVAEHLLDLIAEGEITVPAVPENYSFDACWTEIASFDALPSHDKFSTPFDMFQSVRRPQKFCLLTPTRDLLGKIDATIDIRKLRAREKGSDATVTARVLAMINASLAPEWYEQQHLLAVTALGRLIDEPIVRWIEGQESGVVVRPFRRIVEKNDLVGVSIEFASRSDAQRFSLFLSEGKAAEAA